MDTRSIILKILRGEIPNGKIEKVGLYWRVFDGDWIQTKKVDEMLKDGTLEMKDGELRIRE